MKLSPGFAVIVTTMRSDITLVPPVTEQRSPPDSRMTGADSPVMADSSTLAIALDDVAVAGDHLAGDDHDPVAREQLGRRDVLGGTGLRRGGERSCRSWRRAGWRPAPCPRPSATASARLANTTVSQSQTTTDQAKALGDVTASDGREHRTHLDDEHDGVADHHARVELADGVRQGGQQHPGVEQAARDPVRGSSWGPRG